MSICLPDFDTLKDLINDLNSCVCFKMYHPGLQLNGDFQSSRWLLGNSFTHSMNNRENIAMENSEKKTL